LFLSKLFIAEPNRSDFFGFSELKYIHYIVRDQASQVMKWTVIQALPFYDALYATLLRALGRNNALTKEYGHS
jgi:hypothetical protein